MEVMEAEHATCVRRSNGEREEYRDGCQESLAGIVGEKYRKGVEDTGRCIYTLASQCKKELEEKGVVALHDFLDENVVQELVMEALAKMPDAYYTSSKHNVYLTPQSEEFPPDHVHNVQLSSGKGCIQDDQIGTKSKLRLLYQNDAFRKFVAYVVDETELYQYADTLASINIHYASAGQNLNYHFDNSEFAITLLLQKPEDGGLFQYVRDVRDAERGDMNYAMVEKVLNNEVEPTTLTMLPGTLVLFRGRNSIHRVTPTIGETTRILCVLAFNSEPGVSLSESARMTFFGRLS